VHNQIGQRKLIRAEKIVDKRTLASKLSQELRYVDTNANFDFDDYMREVRAYFDGELPGQIDEDIDEVFQNVVSKDIANAVEHTLADIMPAFSSNRLITFKPEGPEDIAKASAETVLVNNIVLEQSDGLTSFTESIKDALMYRRGVMMVSVVETIVPKYEEVNEVLFEELVAEGKDIISINETLVDEIEEEELEQYLGQTVSAWTREYDTLKQLNIKSIPIDEFKVNSDHESIDLDSARLVARDYRVMASDIVQLGYDQDMVRGLPDYSDAGDSFVQGYEDLTTADESTRAIRLVTAYYRIDYDGDGIAELRHILAAGNDSALEILENKPVDDQPFVLGVPLIDQHHSYGISLADKLQDVQIIKSKLLRQILSANERAIRGRVGLVEGMVNKDDYLDSAFGGVVRMSAPGGIVPLPADAFPQSAYELLGYEDKIRRESGGSAIDKASQENMPIGQESSAHGVERMMSAMEQLNSYIASNILHTLIKKVFCKTHYILRQFWDTPVSAEDGQTWVVGTPTEWPARQRVSTTVGLTRGERAQYVGLLTQLIQEALQLQEKGSLLVTDETVYKLIQQRSMYTTLPGTSDAYISPQSPEYAQMSQQRQQAAEQDKQMQMQQMQQQNDTLMALEETRAHARVQAQQIKAQSDILTNEQTNNTKLESDLRQLELDYQKLNLKLVELNAEYDEEPVPDAA